MGARDVVVVGGGLAGLTAATRAAELGARVVLLEQGGRDYVCNSRLTGGVFHIAFTDPDVAPEIIVERLASGTFGSTDPQLAHLLADNALRACEWLSGHGAKFKPFRLADGSLMNHMLAPQGLGTSWVEWEGKGPTALLERLTESFLEAGGEFRYLTRVTSLIMDGHAIGGVEALTPRGAERIYARSVVMADGGFQGNPWLVKQNISPQPAAVVQRGAGTGIGTGLLIAQSAGARLVHLDSFYGHLLSAAALTNPRLWPYPVLDPVATAGIVVDRFGRRFLNEALGGVDMANKIARRQDPSGAMIVCDSRVWNSPGIKAAATVPAVAGVQTGNNPNPTIEKEGGVVHTASTLAELAVTANLPELETTVNDYNAAVYGGTLSDLPVPRGVHAPGRMFQAPSEALPLALAPFVAVPVCAGITFTMGGPLIDRYARVMHEGGTPIPGLYAVGSASAGFDGGPDVGYAGGLLKATVTGLTAAENICQDA